MNKHMRRYLDEDWEDDEQPTREERETSTTKRTIAQDRRQIEKTRGKAISNFLRSKRKLDGPKGKQ